MNSLRIPLVVWLVVIVLGGLQYPTQTKAETIKTITAPEVKNMMDKGDVVLIHTLSVIEFEIQHIPDSINIPVINIKTTDKLPEDNKTLLIFYCMGVR